MEQSQKTNSRIMNGFFVANVIILLLFFWKSSQYEPFSSVSSMLKAVGHLSGLFLAFFILVQTLLMSRLTIIEKALGKERSTKLHHDLGYFILTLIIIHPLALTIGYNLVRSPGLFAQFKHFLLNFEDVMTAFIGTLLFLAVALSSVYLVKKRIKYEYWYYVHLLSYAAIIMTFMHQVNTGPDFVGNSLFQAYWYSLYGATALTIGWFRFISPIVNSFKNDYHVAKVVTENHDTYSMYITGKNLKQMKFYAGQFASLRFLTPSLLMQSHPFSYSSAPGKNYVRFTIKKLGDYTTILDTISTGTRVIMEGPMGKLISSKKDSKVLLIGGGVGITPLRAMMEPLIKQRVDIALIYCIKTPEDIVFKEEFESVKNIPNVSITYLYSRSAPAGIPLAYLNEETLRRCVEDAPDRQVFICGPQGLMDTATKSLIALGTPEKNIHSESFAY